MLGPGKSGRQLLQLGNGHRIVDFPGVPAVGSGPRRHGDPVLQLIDGGGACFGVLQAYRGESLSEVLLVRLAGRDDLLVVAQIVVAVRKTEPRLPQLDDVGVGMFVVRGDEHPKRSAKPE